MFFGCKVDIMLLRTQVHSHETRYTCTEQKHASGGEKWRQGKALFARFNNTMNLVNDNHVTLSHSLRMRQMHSHVIQHTCSSVWAIMGQVDYAQFIRAAYASSQRFSCAVGHSKSQTNHCESISECACGRVSFCVCLYITCSFLEGMIHLIAL